jgi:putative membrane protein
MTIRHVNLALAAGLAAILVASLLGPADLFTWCCEVAPVVLGAAALLATRRRFAFSELVYVLLFFHALILIWGGAYTYAANPLFDWLKQQLHLARNHYDRLGHFAQGFVPALVAREVLLRLTPLRRGGWLFFVVTCVCLAVSAFYELVEWWVSAATGTSADAFLGTQGDVWDSQWDMLMALVGAIASQLVLARAHDRSMEKATARSGR